MSLQTLDTAKREEVVEYLLEQLRSYQLQLQELELHNVRTPSRDPKSASVGTHKANPVVNWLILVSMRRLGSSILLASMPTARVEPHQ